MPNIISFIVVGNNKKIASFVQLAIWLLVNRSMGFFVTHFTKIFEIL
jgi:hypothetical protein